MKSFRIFLYLASDIVQWQEDKYAPQQQQFANQNYARSEMYSNTYGVYAVIN